MKRSELQALVVQELKALAKKMKVKLPSAVRKADIVELLSAAFRKKKTKPSPASTAAKAKSARTTAAKPVRKSVRPARDASAREKKAVVAKQDAARKTVVPKPAAGAAPGVNREWKRPPAVEEPLMAQERVSDAKYYTGPGQQPAELSYAELPLGYGEEKIALMVRDPYIAYAYWEVTPSRLQRERTWFGWSSKLTVRVYDVTGVEFNGRNAAGYYDQEVSELIGSWYFDLGRPAHSFIADIGLLSPDGRYLTLERSNYVLMPRDGVSDTVDEEWTITEEEFWKLYGFPAGPSSLQMQEMMRIRRMRQVGSPGLFPRARARRK